MLPYRRPDPYNAFKSDRERRLALNTKVRWYCAAFVAAAGVQDLDALILRLRTLLDLFP